MNVRRHERAAKLLAAEVEAERTMAVLTGQKIADVWRSV